MGRWALVPGRRIAAMAFVLGCGGAGCLEAREGAADTGRDPSGEVDADQGDASGDTGTDTGAGVDTTADAADTGTIEGPVAVINTGTTEATVEPQTVLHLDGSQSSRGAVGFAWRVVSAPTGSVSVFRPSASVASPTFEVNIAGTYVFELVVSDAEGQRSAPVYFTARVVSSSGLHIELIWHTPGDADETDEGGDGIYHSAGSDVDLHLKVGGDAVNFFDINRDCHFAAPNPQASGESTVNNARLDRDDTDGGGPENINVDEPAPGIYDVGVHYWNDWGYGHAFATVRIYMDGELAAEWSEVELQNQVMWTPFRIEYPGGTITQIFGRDGGPSLHPSYPVPAIP